MLPRQQQQQQRQRVIREHAITTKMLHLFWLFKNLLIFARAGDTRTHTHKTHVRAANTASHTHKHTRAQLETSDCVTYEKVIGRVGVEERGRGTEHWSRTVVKKKSILN